VIPDQRKGRLVPGLVLLALALLCATIVVVPIVLIRPFGRQTPDILSLSYTLRAWSPFLTLASLVVAGILSVLLWPRVRTWKGKGTVAIGLAAIAATSWLARQNHFERIFHPIDRPELADASKAAGLEADDLVLGVRRGDEARAYPVRALAYHHLVNDRIGGEPIVATY